MRVNLKDKAEQAVAEMMALTGATADEVIRRALGMHLLLLEEKKRGARVWIDGPGGGRREIIVK